MQGGGLSRRERRQSMKRQGEREPQGTAPSARGLLRARKLVTETPYAAECRCPLVP